MKSLKESVGEATKAAAAAYEELAEALKKGNEQPAAVVVHKLAIAMGDAATALLPPLNSQPQIGPTEALFNDLFYHVPRVLVTFADVDEYGLTAVFDVMPIPHNAQHLWVRCRNRPSKPSSDINHALFNIIKLGISVGLPKDSADKIDLASDPWRPVRDQSKRVVFYRKLPPFIIEEATKKAASTRVKGVTKTVWQVIEQAPLTGGDTGVPSKGFSHDGDIGAPLGFKNNDHVSFDVYESRRSPRIPR